MSLERVQRLLKQKEGIRLEFKASRTDLPTNLFESICAMLNREGGDILLGILDDGSIKGIEADRLETIKGNLVTLSNNPNKIDPPFILFPQAYKLKGRAIVHIQVPESSQLHKSAGVVYDRSRDGDFRVIQPQQIAEIYNRKRAHYTESIVYPALHFKDFKPGLFPKSGILSTAIILITPGLRSTTSPCFRWQAFGKGTIRPARKVIRWRPRFFSEKMK